MSDEQFKQFLKTSVYDETGKKVSHVLVNYPATRKEIEESYAKGCGHANAIAMRKAGYPLDNFTFEHDCPDCQKPRAAHLPICKHCGTGV